MEGWRTGVPAEDATATAPSLQCDRPGKPLTSLHSRAGAPSRPPSRGRGWAARGGHCPHPTGSLSLLCPVPRQTRRGAHGRGAAPVASRGAAGLLFVCPRLKAPPRRLLFLCGLPASLTAAGAAAGGLRPPGPRAPRRVALRGPGTHMTPGPRLPRRRPRRKEACGGSRQSCPLRGRRGKENENQRSNNTKHTDENWCSQLIITHNSTVSV